MLPNVLSLDSPRWSELRHAYGPASDAPNRLKQLADMPAAEGESEPWYFLWSALAHQGDVYSASFAAVPHVVAAAATRPGRASSTYFDFPAWVEICRQQKNVGDVVTKVVSYKATIPTDSPFSIVSGGTAHEAISYVDASDQVVLMVVLACHDEKELEKSRGALTSLVQSLRVASANAAANR